MTNAWNQARQLMKKYARQKSYFLRLTKDGDREVVAFCGEPYVRELHWTGERYEECSGTACRYCATGHRSTIRVLFNVYLPSLGKMKIMEGGLRWFKDVLKVRDKYGVDKWLFEIERHGDAGDTNTTYSILPEKRITSRITAKINAAGLHALSQFGKYGVYIH